MYLYTRVLLPLSLIFWTGVVAAAAAAVRHHMPNGKNCCLFFESDFIQYFLSLHSNTIHIFLFTPWQYCWFYGLELPILHPRYLRACAEPRCMWNQKTPNIRKIVKKGYALCLSFIEKVIYSLWRAAGWTATSPLLRDSPVVLASIPVDRFLNTQLSECPFQA